MGPKPTFPASYYDPFLEGGIGTGTSRRKTKKTKRPNKRPTTPSSPPIRVPKRRTISYAQRRERANTRSLLETTSPKILSRSGWLDIDARLRRGGISKPQRERAKFSFLQRNDVNEVSQLASRPAPKHGSYKANEAYQLHRGYFFKDSDGVWRTPDGKRAKGQKLVPGRDGKTTYWDSPKAKAHNARWNARLLKEDAYSSLLSHGIPIKRRAFDRAVKNIKFRKGTVHEVDGKKVNSDRHLIRDRLAKSRVVERTLRRFERTEAKRTRKGSKKTSKGASSDREYGGLRDSDGEGSSDGERISGGGGGGGGGGDFLDEDVEGEENEGVDVNDYDDIFDQWYDDFDGRDGGDTP